LPCCCCFSTASWPTCAQSVLAAVLIATALTLMNLDALRRYYRVRRSALVLSFSATAGIVVLGVLPGIVIAIGLAIVLFLRRSWRANGAVLGRAPRPGGWQSVARHRDAHELRGLVVFRWEAPLFFANTSQFRDQVRELVRDRHASWVIIQCEAVTDVDVTAAEILKQLDLDAQRGRHAPGLRRDAHATSGPGLAVWPV
jgi:MFS superfamily sulfate permease-like transporter